MDKKWRNSIFQLLPLDGRYFLTVALKTFPEGIQGEFHFCHSIREHLLLPYYLLLHSFATFFIRLLLLLTNLKIQFICHLLSFLYAFYIFSDSFIAWSWLAFWHILQLCFNFSCQHFTQSYLPCCIYDSMEFLLSVIIEVRVRARFSSFTIPKFVVLFAAISGPFNVTRRVQMNSSPCRI